MSWAVAMIMPNSERRAVLNLERQGFEVYAPHCKPSRISRVVALFPGYAFIRIEHFWTSILGTFGVRGLIMNGEKPGVVADEIVQDIKKKQGPDGLVNLKHKWFVKGQTVKIKHGTFQDNLAIYDGQSGADRCFVLLQLLGRQVRTQVNERDIALV